MYCAGSVDLRVAGAFALALRAGFGVALRGMSEQYHAFKGDGNAAAMSEIADWTLFQWIVVALLVLILLRSHFGLWYVAQMIRALRNRRSDD